MNIKTDKFEGRHHRQYGYKSGYSAVIKIGQITAVYLSKYKALDRVFKYLRSKFGICPPLDT